MAKIDKKKKSLASKPFKRQNPVKKSQAESTKILKQTSATSNKLISKKTKRLQKKSALITKLSESNEAKKKIQKAKLKAQTVIVGNMDPLLDALTAIAATNESAAKKRKEEEEQSKLETSERKNKHPTEKTRIRSNLKDINLFQQVTTHPKFTTNPINAITDHVKYLMQMEQDQ